MVNGDLKLLVPNTYDYFRRLMSVSKGYDHDSGTWHVKMFNRFSFNFHRKASRKYFIDEYCEKLEQVYGGYTLHCSEMVSMQFQHLYGSCLDMDIEIATDSYYEIHEWDDDDYGFHTGADTVKVEVICLYKIFMKEGMTRNQLKLKYPELIDIGFFAEEDEKSFINKWFLEKVFDPVKLSIGAERELINAYKKKADFEF